MSYYVKSKKKTLAELAAASDWGFIQWASDNMSVPDAVTEAKQLLASRPASEATAPQRTDDFDPMKMYGGSYGYDLDEDDWQEYKQSQRGRR